MEERREDDRIKDQPYKRATTTGRGEPGGCEASSY